jgi:hypothetical protein
VQFDPIEAGFKRAARREAKVLNDLSNLVLTQRPGGDEILQTTWGPT